MNTIRYIYQIYFFDSQNKISKKMNQICLFLFDKKTVYYKFSQSRNSFSHESVPWLYRHTANRTPTVPLVCKRAPRLRRTGVPLLMTEIAAPISLGLQPAGDRAPFIFLLVNKMLYKRRQTCISIIASFRFEGQFLAQKWH